MSDSPPPALPVFAPHGAVDAVLALDRPGMLAETYRLRGFRPGERLEIGPFTADTLLLPHFVPNAGIRLRTPESVLVHTGDTGPTDAPYLLTARLAGRYAQQAGVARLLLTHLWPSTEHLAAEEAAAEAFDRPLGVATPGLVVEL